MKDGRLNDARGTGASERISMSGEDSGTLGCLLRFLECGDVAMKEDSVSAFVSLNALNAKAHVTHLEEAHW